MTHSCCMVRPARIMMERVRTFFLDTESFKMQNDDLKWEVLTQMNIGLDFELFDSKISGTLEAYEKKQRHAIRLQCRIRRSELLCQLRYTSNVGEMSNKGIELSLGGDCG